MCFYLWLYNNNLTFIFLSCAANEESFEELPESFENHLFTVVSLLVVISICFDVHQLVSMV